MATLYFHELHGLYKVNPNLKALRCFAQVIKAERARVEAAQAAAPGLSTYELDMLLAKARRVALLRQLTSLQTSQDSLVWDCAPYTRERMADFAWCCLVCAVSCAPRPCCSPHISSRWLSEKCAPKCRSLSGALARADVREVGEACRGRSEGVRRPHRAGA